MIPLRNEPGTDILPEIFCWTKFGDEAGEAPGYIFQRKEVERQRNCGTFLWGIGQSIRPSLAKLLSVTSAPEILFSPMRSAPARRDVSPSSIVVWHEGIAMDGRRYVLPKNTLVTSRRDDRYPRDYHFALVCGLADPIRPGSRGCPNLRAGSLRNLVSGASVGSSQVTSVVRRIKATGKSSAEYPVEARARLVSPYLIRLTHGVVVPVRRHPDGLGGASKLLSMDELLRYRYADQECGNEAGNGAGLLG